MEFESKKIIKNLEDKIENSYSLPIFRGYKAIDKRGIEKLIAELYATLPNDVKAARAFLEKNRTKSNTKPQQIEQQENLIYTYLKELDKKINKTVQFAKFTFINIKELEKIINKISDNLPEEIIQAENLNDK